RCLIVTSRPAIDSRATPACRLCALATGAVRDTICGMSTRASRSVRSPVSIARLRAAANFAVLVAGLNPVSLFAAEKRGPLAPDQSRLEIQLADPELVVELVA